MNAEQCSGTIGGTSFTARCSREGKFEVEGKWYCRVHTPAAPVIEEDVYEDVIELCACGCGEQLNPILAVIRTMAEDGLTNAFIARHLNYDRSFVTTLLRDPPKFIRGHQSREFWADHWEERGGREIEMKRRGLIRAHEVEMTRRKAAGRHNRRLQVRAQRRAQQEYERAERTFNGLLVNGRCVSLDWTPDDSTESMLGWLRRLDPVELGSRFLLHDPLEIVIEMETRAELRAIIGGMDLEDIRVLDGATLSRLRDRLIDANMTPRSIQNAERARLRDPAAHSGREFGKSKSLGSKEKRRQKVGKTGRPADKPMKRWEATISGRERRLRERLDQHADHRDQLAG